MNERNDRVAQMLAADAPAARDLAFEIAVLARIEQRRFHRSLALSFVLTAAVVALLAWVMPGIETLWQARLANSISNGAIAAMLFALMLPLQWWITRRA